MKRSPAFTRLLLSVLVCLFFLLLLPTEASAQNPDATVTATLTTPDEITFNRIENAMEFSWFLLPVIFFSLVALGILFFYTYRIQVRFYDATEKLARLGRSTQIRDVQPFLSAERNLEESIPNDAPSASLTIEGPGEVIIGKPSGKYKATISDGQSADKVTWTINPTQGAYLNTSQGSEVQVVITEAGVYTLSATLAGATLLKPAALQINAIEPVTDTIQLPFIGQGYGSIALAIVLIAAILVLGGAGILNSTGVTALLSGLVGYAFGIAAAKGQP